jgi:Kelch motif protein
MAGTWQPLTHQPSFNASTMILLTDGRVMVQEEATEHWHALTPTNGSYVDGTWSVLRDMAFWRRYYASGVLKDGRVFLCGGEQSGDVGETNKGQIYDPVADTWSDIPLPSWSQVGDAACCVLPDGRVLVGDINSTNCIIYDPSTNSWTSAGSKAVTSSEETWILLPDNTIVTCQCWSPYKSEKYVISSNTWKDEGSLPVTVADSVMHEIGAGTLLYNGHAIFFGAANSSGNGKTVLYAPPATPSGTGTWTAGPNIPKVGNQTIVSNDCPASLLPNGKVLFTAANFLNNDWGNPIVFFEYDPVANTITQAPSPPNNAKKLYWSRMMLLPTGQVLFSPSSNNIQCYTPDGGPQDAWRPTISAVTPHVGIFGVDSYLLQGTQLNGLSQANMYGDDCYPCTNYPLVRLRAAGTGNISYCRTYDFSTMGVATGGALQSCSFKVLGGVPDGQYDLCVVANGISSNCVPFTYVRPTKPRWIDMSLKREFEFRGKEIYEGDPFNRWEWVVDPEVIEMKSQLKSLQNSVNRLSSLIQARQLPEVGKSVAQSAAETEKKVKSERDAQKNGA